MTMGKEETFNRLAKAIIDGDEKAASEVSQQVLQAGIDPLEAILQGATKGLDEVGERFDQGELFLPELILAGDAMKVATAILTPHIRADKAGAPPAKVVIGTVLGDIHDIGKTIVANMLSVGGFEVYDLGIDVPVKQFINKAEEVQAKVIAMSALLTLTAVYQEEVIKYLKDAGLREKYYVIVGGSPISGEWATKIGADGYAKTAPGARELVKRLLIKGGPPPLPKPIVVEQ